MNRLVAAGQLKRLAGCRTATFPLRLTLYSYCPLNRPRRYSTTVEGRGSAGDHSPIDHTYMPQPESEPQRQSDILRLPRLPTSSGVSSNIEDAPELVVRPQIATVSANGTHIDNPSPLSEVTDNHAIDISPFNLTDQVTSAATAAASKVTGLSEERLKEQGVFLEAWSGLLDDMLGERKVAKG